MDERRRRFDDIYGACREACWAWVRGMLPEDDAADAFQETWLVLWKRLERIDVAYPRAYVLRVARSRVRDRLERPQRPVGVDDVVDPGSFVDEDLQDRVRRALTRIAPERREVVLLRHHAGLSYEEIAHVLDVPSGTVGSRLHLAAKDLRGALAAIALEEST